MRRFKQQPLEYADGTAGEQIVPQVGLINYSLDLGPFRQWKPAGAYFLNQFWLEAVQIVFILTIAPVI